MVLTQRRIPVEFFALAGVIFIAAICIAQTLSSSAADSLVAFGVLLDLTLLVPGLYYWLGVKRAGLPAATVVPVFLFCVFAASRILPGEHASLLDGLYFLVPVAELAIFAAVAVSLHRAIRKKASIDTLETVQETVHRMTGSERVAKAVAYEIALFSYALTRRKPLPLQPGEFSYHRRTPLYAYTGALLLVTAAEVAPVHYLLNRWSPAVAWIVLALTLYSTLWFIGDVRAVSRRPIQLDADGLRLRFGLRWDVQLPWSALAEVETGTGFSSDSKTALKLVPLGSGANCRLVPRMPVDATGPYGIQRQVDEILLFVDDPGEFKSAIEQKVAMARSQ